MQAHIKLGFAPTRRAIFSAPAAVAYRKLTAERLRALGIDFVDIDDINEEGLLYDDAGMQAIAEKFKREKVDGLFLPHANFGTEYECARLAKELYANVPEAKMRGFNSGRFSFNIKGGRCEACQGDGIIKIEMHFLPDVYVACDVCKGRRYNRETLEVKYKGKSIYDVLEMTVEEGVEFFKDLPKIERKLRTLYDVGLGYIKIGQPATTLSGGEAQRVKLATELSPRPTGRKVYILDEPTTGLHIADVHRLIEVLQKLVDGGNTVIVIEHNLDLIKTADHIIDLGPEGGDKGGTVIAEGTPEEVAKIPGSYTGEFIKLTLERDKQRGL